MSYLILHSRDMDATLGHGSMKVEEPSHTGGRLLPPKILFNSGMVVSYIFNYLLKEKRLHACLSHEFAAQEPWYAVD